MEADIDIARNEAERDGVSSGAGLLIGVLFVSFAVHVALMYTCSDCAFAPLPGESQNIRKWTKQKPTMQVEKMDKDPLARIMHAPRPAAAPVTEKQEERIERLAAAAEPTLLPELPKAASTTPMADVAPEPAKPDAAEWVPRQQIAAIEAPTVPDDEAALPRIVIPKVERVGNAPDITPAYELMAPAGGGSSGASSAGGSGLSSIPPAVTGDDQADVYAPTAPLPMPTDAGSGISSSFERPPSLSVLSAAEEAAVKKAADDARAAEKAGKAADARRDEELAKAAKAPPPPDAAAVDEKVVAKEKEAVRALRDEAAPLGGKPLDGRVDVAFGVWADPARPDEKFFRISVSSNKERPLQVVSKDIVYLLDASGSIANDRLKACRKSISKALRLLNTGDRFNVIAFRDKFSYAFTDEVWKDVTDESLEKADRWLAKLTAHGQTDVFQTLRGVLSLPRDPTRPVVAFFVTDAEPTCGMTRSTEIVSHFARLNDGLISIYMYGVKDSANAFLMDMVTNSSRGGWARHDGMRWFAADGIPALSKKFERPVLADISILFAATSNADAYPRLVTNLCIDEPVEIFGKCPASQKEIVFSMRGLNGADVYESLFKLSFDKAARLGPETRTAWAKRRMHALVGRHAVKPSAALMKEIRAFAAKYQVQIPYEKEMR